VPSAAKVDHAVVNFYTERVLHSLLDVATMATRAEGGSVMVYEDDGETLKIKAARGLSDVVVAETRQKPGEGLAGVATRQRDILLIDDRTADASLKPLMQRTELASSLIAPVTPEPDHRPIGVLNLRTANRERRFTPEHVEMLRRLLDLAGIALGNLRFTLPKPS
jgi:GAF domain-containing protein